MKKTLLTVAAVVLAMALPALAILVCKRCGYELNQGAASCSHCGATVMTNVVAAAPQSYQEEKGAVLADLVEKEIEEGRRQRDRGDIDVAAALFRNALALEQVVPGAGDSARGERIRRLLQSSGSGSLMVPGPCSSCGGSGKMVFTAPVLDGKTETVPSGVACRACDGTGKAMRAATVSEVHAGRLSAMKRFVELQQSRKYVAVGGAWVPVSIETNLTVRQTALLKRTAAPPCQTCVGTGLQECPACRGSRWLRCSNRKCDRGTVLEKPANGLKGSDAGPARKVKCRTCGGAGHEKCAVCIGKGHVECAACKGTGEREVCRGGSIMLCGSCKGDGRKR
jgi:hypothetical protein